MVVHIGWVGEEQDEGEGEQPCWCNDSYQGASCARLADVTMKLCREYAAGSHHVG